MEALIRSAYGLLLVFFLWFAWSESARFFVSERWGGYAASGPWADRLQHPQGVPYLIFCWMVLAILLIIGLWAPWVALLNVIICRYFFVSLRWKSLTRGFGAPGFMNYWLGAVVFGLEFTRHYLPDQHIWVLWTAQIDFALIMLSSGFYKLKAGYPRNQGMELGMVNPQWGYWWTFFQRLSPQHPIFWFLNQSAWSVQIMAALMMLIPSLRFWGGVLIALSFAFLITQIRLGTLCYVVILGSLLFFEPGSWGEQLLSPLIQVLPHSSAPALILPVHVALVWQGLLWIYLLLLPLAHIGISINFYGQQRLPGLLQSALEKYSNFFGIIVWRVFSIDLIQFYIRIFSRAPTGDITLISKYGALDTPRFRHVVECIAITSIFTTLKYFSAESGLFQQRLLRYARTISYPAEDQLVFEFVLIEKTATQFCSTPVVQFAVDRKHQQIEEIILDPERYPAVRQASNVSPVRTGITPGSYVPLAPTPFQSSSGHP